jgi:acetyltransferase-like isoleucine patch superfamily enzyme
MIKFRSISCDDFIASLGSIVEVADAVTGGKQFTIDKILSLDDVSNITKEGASIVNSVLWVKTLKNIEQITVKESFVLVSEGELKNDSSDCLFIKSVRSRDVFGEITNVISHKNGFRQEVQKRGTDCGYTLWNNVRIAKDVLVGPNSSIGGPGFGYYRNVDGKRKRFAHLGGCVIESGCEIGACVTIDSGTLSPTVICKDVKIDSNVHIGHNAKIGRGTVICASSTICGSVEVGEEVFIGAGAIIMDKVKIPDGSVVGLGSVIRKSPKEQAKIIPVFENRFRKL